MILGLSLDGHLLVLTVDSRGIGVGEGVCLGLGQRRTALVAHRIVDPEAAPLAHLADRHGLHWSIALGQSLLLGRLVFTLVVLLALVLLDHGCGELQRLPRLVSFLRLVVAALERDRLL